MKKITWYLNRLKAMDIEEVFWRIQQKNLQKKEKREFYEKHVSVFSVPLSEELINLSPQVNRISINWDNKSYTLFKGHNLFNAFSYEKYKNKWSAGFQTENEWPVDQYSYDISISQRDEIGDIRTNWELNRHFQFSSLAKTFYVTGNKSVLNELTELFYHWNNRNLFLHGVEWTSAMEIAIRVNSWIYTYFFLEKSFEKYAIEYNKILTDLSHGILAMTEYIVNHHAKFSSANNHLIVEMYAVGLSGIFFDYKNWQKVAIDILTEELSRQNYCDGVNKEMSLHYQSFVMEAYGLLMIEMLHNNISIPQSWKTYLTKMSEFVRDCSGDNNETIVFGDNDEGKILDLCGVSWNHYIYVLQLMSCVLEVQFTSFDIISENLQWIISDNLFEVTQYKSLYYVSESKVYEEGGYTIWRDVDNDLLFAVDHANLGFGSIAAHGHADALSFQLYLDGSPVFVDAGTYNYHSPSKIRNSIRSVYNHNTVQIGDIEQSEMLGPFLWGKQCRCQLEQFKNSSQKIYCVARADYLDKTHRRRIEFDKSSTFVIRDTILNAKDEIKRQIFLINPDCEVKLVEENKVAIFTPKRVVYLQNMSMARITIEEFPYSSEYNHLSVGSKVIFVTSSDLIETKIKIESRG